MNRTQYFNYCEERISTLTTSIEMRGRLNILDAHLHSEDFYRDFLNLLFNFSLKNMNEVKQNAEAIDLVDLVGRLVVQVSSTSTKVKVESALSKDLSTYKGHNFKFVSICKSADPLRTMTFKNPHSLVFDPSKDIYDSASFIEKILHLDVATQREVYEFIRRELGHSPDKIKVSTNLAAIISVLSKEDLGILDPINSIPAFNLDKKIDFNQLKSSATLIEDHKIHYARVNKIYTEYDKAGSNKSESVLRSLRSIWLQLKASYSGDELFYRILNEAMTKVRESANYPGLADEELELCVSIIVVDAFIRCKIFTNPEMLNNAVT